MDEDGQVLSTARNTVEGRQDGTVHAEIEAIRKACDVRKNWRLLGCTLYTTLEPCIMCLGAIQSSRIKKVVYAAKDFRLGACGSWVDLVNDVKHPFHQIQVVGGVLEDESAILMRRFFQSRRREKADDDYTSRGQHFL